MTDYNSEQIPERVPAVPVRAAKPQSRDRSTQVLLVLGALVAVAGLAFAGGRFSAPAAAAANPTNARGAGAFAGRSFTPGQFGRNGGTGGLSGGVEGTVESVNGTTLTIQLANGNTATVDLSSTTTYHGETAATATDVKAGSKILVTIDTSAIQPGTGTQPSAAASGAPGGGFGNRTFTAKDVIIVAP